MAKVIHQTDQVTFVHGSAHDLYCIQDNSVNAVFTSVPYYGVRDYDVEPILWHNTHLKLPYQDIFIPKQTAVLGQEDNPLHYIAHLIQFLRETKRIVHPTGLVVVNIGDTYKDKGLMLMPELFALAAKEDGWIVRNAIPWLKDNGMPGNYDRFVLGHENIYILAQQPKYYFDRIAIRQEAAGRGGVGGTAVYQGHPNGTQGAGSKTLHQSAVDGRNPRTKDVMINTLQSFINGAKEGNALVDDEDLRAIIANNEQGEYSHYAPFPLSLARMFVECLTSPVGRCPECYAQWERVYDKVFQPSENNPEVGTYVIDTLGWRQSCECEGPDSYGYIPEPSVICDPFCGTGTVGVAAVMKRPLRRAVLCDLSERYLRDFAMKRVAEVQMRLI